MEDLIILSTKANHHIAQNISNITGIRISEIIYEKFSNGEIFISTPDKCAKTIIVHSLSTSESFIELLFMTKAAQGSDITLCAPYLGYSRHDKGKQNGAMVIKDFIESLGIKKLITVDIHNKSILSTYKIKAISVSTEKLIMQKLHDIDVIISPDAGREVTAKTLAIMTKKIPVICNKTRFKNKVTVEVPHDLQGKRCAIIDDIIDTGGTLRSLCDAMHGAQYIKAFITHTCAKNSLAIPGKINELHTSDSLPCVIPNAHIFSLAKIICEAL